MKNITLLFEIVVANGNDDHGGSVVIGAIVKLRKFMGFYHRNVSIFVFISTSFDFNNIEIKLAHCSNMSKHIQIYAFDGWYGFFVFFSFLQFIHLWPTLIYRYTSNARGKQKHNKIIYWFVFLKTIKLGFICTGRHSNGTGSTLLNDTLGNEDIFFNFAKCKKGWKLKRRIALEQLKRILHPKHQEQGKKEEEVSEKWFKFRKSSSTGTNVKLKSEWVFQWRNEKYIVCMMKICSANDEKMEKKMK